MTELSMAPMHRIAKKAGADRVSEKAAKELGRILEEIGLEICREALNYMMHSRRKTLKPEDLIFAARHFTKMEGFRPTRDEERRT